MTHSTAIADIVQQNAMPGVLGNLSSAIGDLPEGIATPLASTVRDCMLTQHLPMVRFIARRVHARLPKHVELDELVSAGTMGLIDAFEKFDPKKQVQFKSYAQFRVRGAILDSLRTSDWSPRELRRNGREKEKATQTLMSRLGRTPSDTEIAAEMGTSLENYQLIAGQLKGLAIGSLNAERNEESGEEEMAYVAGPATDDPLFQCIEGQRRERLMTAIDDLPEKERLVLTLYYLEELTMKEVGLTLGVVESRVSQIRTAAVARLRNAMGVTLSKPRSMYPNQRI